MPESDRDFETYSVLEAGRLLGLGRNGSYAAAHSGDLPVIRIGRKMRVPKVALRRKLEAAGQPPQAA